MSLFEHTPLNLFFLKTGAAITTISVLAMLLNAQLSRKRISNAKLPPGPRGIPFLGNIIELLTASGDSPSPFLLFPSWYKKYGHIVHFSAFGKHVIVLGSIESANDLLAKRGASYSDRPPHDLENEILGWGSSMAFMRYGDRFRRQKRVSQAVLNPTSSRRFSAGCAHEDIVMNLLSSLSSSPDRFFAHIRVYAAAAVLKVVYGIDLDPEDESILKMNQDVVDGMGAVPRGIINFFPLMKLYATSYPAWLPFSGLKAKIDQLRELFTSTHDITYKAALERIESGIALPSESVINHAIEVQGGLNDTKDSEHEDLKGLAAILTSGGQDTSTVTLTSFVLAMVRHPEIQKKAQAEIDSVIGDGRLPTLDDRESLPYLNALLMELYRWASTFSTAFPHDTLEDDVYNGYFIPKGTTILANILEMLHACPRPEVFEPQRFIDGTDLGKVPKDPREIAFGFGRRRCPGLHLADNCIWMVVTQMLAVFDFLPEIVDGCEVMPPAEFVAGGMRRAKPFKCRILVREGRDRLIRTD